MTSGGQADGPNGGSPPRVAACSAAVCHNTLALPIAETDDAVLSIVEGEVLGTRVIEELLALVDRGVTDDSARLVAEPDRLRGEVENLVASIAAGVPAGSVAEAIRDREA